MRPQDEKDRQTRAELGPRFPRSEPARPIREFAGVSGFRVRRVSLGRQHPIRDTREG